MTTYYMLSPDQTESIFLSTTEQMDRYLQMGCSIYKRVDEQDTLIATPQDGYLIEKPILPESYTMKLR